MTIAKQQDDAPGAPGIGPTWSSSAKDWVGCALGPARLWFTIGGGIVNEVYYPRVDIPQIRDLGFIVADDRGFWCEVKRLGTAEVEIVPGRALVRSVHRHARFVLTLTVAPDPARDVLLIAVDLTGDEALRPFALLAPHLGGTGHDNRAMVGEHRGRRVLWAEQGPFALALAATDPERRDAWGRASAGYVGASDGWQDFTRNGAMRWAYPSAGPGNVALMGELPRRAVLALGLGSSRESAATLAASALVDPFTLITGGREDGWADWQAGWRARVPEGRDLPDRLERELALSAQVLKTHQDKTYPGAMVASLSVPWGSSHDEIGGYHLVWPRDLVETAGALLAIGAEADARDVLCYLIATQNADGHWYQNQWLGGTPYWQGIQLDEAAFPVLLADALARRDALAGIAVGDMVRRALAFIARTGPASDQDRWEEDAGVNTFTLAVCIAALVAGAPFLDKPARAFALALADFWNSRIEAWTTACDTPLARRFRVPRYYVRVAPGGVVAGTQALRRILPIKNCLSPEDLPAEEQVGVDFLQLVRLGLRRTDDPVIRDTITVADGLLRVDTPSGPSWHRYNGDGYGEHEDGAPFDGTGVGRLWPLLTGERGHYELAAGRDPLPFLDAMLRMAGRGGLIPEQVWDAAPVPARFLAPGRPSGSAMPLVWAHAEFIKLAVSRRLGAPVDRPEPVWERYHGKAPSATEAFWTEGAPIGQMAPGSRLSLCTARPAVAHWSDDGWKTVHDTATADTGLGLHAARLSTGALGVGRRIDFTFRDPERGDGGWWGTDYAVAVSDEP